MNILVLGPDSLSVPPSLWTVLSIPLSSPASTSSGQERRIFFFSAPFLLVFVSSLATICVFLRLIWGRKLHLLRAVNKASVTHLPRSVLWLHSGWNGLKGTLRGFHWRHWFCAFPLEHSLICLHDHSQIHWGTVGSGSCVSPQPPWGEVILCSSFPSAVTLGIDTQKARQHYVSW